MKKSHRRNKWLFHGVLALVLSFCIAGGTGFGMVFADDGDTVAVSIESAEVTLEQTEKVYDGSPFTPDPVVVLDGKTLTKGSDYTVSYKDNSGNTISEPTNAGTYSAAVTGVGPAYTGTAAQTVSFEIKGLDISGASVSGIKNFDYTGQAFTQSPTVTMQVGGKTVTLRNGTDYTLSFSNNINAGTATITIKGTGNYAGTKTANFQIYAKNNSAGWQFRNGDWYYYYSNGTIAKNGWIADSVGWCYLGSDGRMLRNSWAKDTHGTCWLGADGYWQKGKWILSNGEWYYLKPNGYRAENIWVSDSVGWCYANADGKLRKNALAADSVGMCYLGSDGYCVKSRWVKINGESIYVDSRGYVSGNRWISDAGGWYYLKSNGTRLRNGWAKDSVGWCWMDANGRITKNKWILDCGQWYYLKPNGYMAASEWATDSGGWCYLGANGAMVKNTGARDSAAWYYMDSSGHISSGTYVIVSTADQQLYYYESGKLVLKTAVVTGKWYPKDHSTPTGTYYLRAKQTNQTLKGLEDDGKTPYSSPVSYWMPFIGNSWGLHDATWRSSFGGSIYKYNGSHGCVNMPYSAAKSLYARIKVGTLIRIQ